MLLFSLVPAVQFQWASHGLTQPTRNMAPMKSEFQFPSCWDDDVRMTALYALPRNENLNPHDWAGKYKFWKDLIIDWATKNGQIIIELEKLKEVFLRKGKIPASLQRVLQEMNKQGELSSTDQCLTQLTPSTWTSWGVGLMKSSMVWSWNIVKNALMEVESTVPRYVLVSVLKERAQEVMQLPVASSGETITVDELMEMHPEEFPGYDEADLILSHLQKSGKVAVDTSSTQTIVKFLSADKPTSKPSVWNLSAAKSPIKAKEPPAEITEAERTLATLKRTEKLLNEEIDKLHNDMNILEQTARSKLREGARSAAKAALYRRKQLQVVFDKRNQALMNIQTIKLQLSQAQTDSKIMEAYQMGLSALKNSFSDLPLNEDKLQDTLIELESVLEQQRDIENTLANSIMVTEETESDLEEELKNILADTSAANQSAADQSAASEAELDWPSVPTESPRSARLPKKSVPLLSDS